MADKKHLNIFLKFRGILAKSLSWLLVFLLTFYFTVNWGHTQQSPPKPPQEWQLNGIMAALDDPDPQIWALALNKLSEFKIDELEIPQSEYKKIVYLLSDDNNPDVQSAAAEALGGMGEAAAGQAPQLLKLLETSNNPDVKRAAAMALGSMGETADTQVPQLLKLLETSNDPDVKWAAAVALGGMGEATATQAPQLGKLLETSNDPDVKWAAAVALGEMGEAAAAQAPQLGKLLETSSDTYVQWNAANALGEMGEAAADQAPQLLKLLETSSDERVQRAAAVALGGMGEAAAAHVQTSQLLKLLETSNDSDVQDGAAKVLGSMGEAAAAQAPQLLKLLETPGNTNRRFAAAEALGSMGEAAAAQAPQLLKLLETSEDIDVQQYAAIALGGMGKAAAVQAPQLLKLLATSEDTDVVRATSAALGGMGEAAAAQAPQLAKLLETSSDTFVQASAAEVLGKMGEAAAAQAPQLLKLLETSSDTFVQASAAEALGSMGETAAAQAPQLLKFLETSNDPDVQRAAAEALGSMGEAAAAHVQTSQLLKLLETSNNLDVQRATTKVLRSMGKANTETILSILNAVYGNRWQREYRFLAYFLSGAKEESIIAIQWLGLPKEYPDLENREQRIKILQVFNQAWKSSESLPRLRNDLERKIAEVIKEGTWKFQDIGLLTKHYQNLQSVNSTHADAVKAKIAQLEGWKWFFAAWRIWLAHFLFWLVLIFAYPKFPQIQAIFFWNPWVRRIIGLGYVGFLITWIPFLRSKLFVPFKKSLLADAKLDYSDLQFYFDKSEVKQEASGKVQPLKDAIPKIKGQIILQGESGLGKSLFLRYLAKNSQRIVVYLSADRCTDGVIEAIQNKLLGKARDFNFLRDLIYSGAIDICLDGLNEVNADTRATIKEFVERYFKGNIIMTTQPLEWKPPTTASIYILQPLQEDLIREFLLSRQSSLAEDKQLQIPNYQQACQDYLAKALARNLSEEELAANQKILSNPMDLTILGQVIARGEEPDLFRLQQQQYKLMADDYEDKQHEEFPLAKFSQHAYQIRLNNLSISETDFLEELQCMLRHKMVICQQFRDAQNKNVREWKFRHDKIWEFFILQTFFGKDNELPNQHKNDPRFRGVYFLLANLLPLDEAEKLRENLIQYAADSGDHTVSDRFIQILRTRR